jgi:hypothetical protein
VAAWKDVEQQAPDFAKAVRAAFDAHKHKTLATLRKDGSPRISGTEMAFALGDVWMGGMTGARKAADLLRDPRMALHSATADPELTLGDAKLSGRAIEVPDEATWHAVFPEAPPFDEAHLFRVDISEAALTRVEGDKLVIQSWSEAGGLRTIER